MDPRGTNGRTPPKTPANRLLSIDKMSNGTYYACLVQGGSQSCTVANVCGTFIKIGSEPNYLLGAYPYKPQETQGMIRCLYI
jgi:hypothetical protein